MKKLILLFFLGAGSFSLFAQDSTATKSTSDVSMITNRPGFTEASRAVYKGGFQIESSIEYGKVPELQGSSNHSEYLYLPSFGFLYGVSKNVEFRVFATNYATRSNVNGGYTQFVFNLSSVNIGSKINLLSPKGLIPELALLINQGVPSNPADIRKQWPTSAILAWSYSLQGNLGVSGNLGYINHKEVFEQDITVDHGWSYTLNVGYNIQEDIGVFAEVFGENKINNGRVFSLNLDGGVWYRINSKLQVDASAGYGVEVGKYYVNAGFSWLLMK